jgi:hypothetical protein
VQKEMHEYTEFRGLLEQPIWLRSQLLRYGLWLNMKVANADVHIELKQLADMLRSDGDDDNNEQSINIKLLDETINISLQGMVEKSAEFKASGSRIYQPVKK